jgi:adenylate cyclase ExoY
MLLRATHLQHTGSVINPESSVESAPKTQEQRLADVKELCRTEKVGIVPEHLVKLQTLAQEKNCIIGIRPVDEMATDLIKDGHPTKGFHIKGKSSDWGPHTSCICVDQGLSKLAGKPDKTVAEYNDQVKTCLSSTQSPEGEVIPPYAQKVPLEISKSRLDTLIEKGIVYNVKYNVNRDPVELKAKAPTGDEHTFQLSRNKEPGAYLVKHNREPIEVLALPGDNKKPITADYDLLMIAPSLEDFGAQDMLPLHEASHTVYKARIDSYRTSPENLAAPLKELYSNPAKFYAREDKDIGNASLRIRNMIPEINKHLVGNGEPVVHHSSDTGNPATDMKANFPATFTLPKALRQFAEICVIRNFDELKTLVQVAKDEGYHVPLNPLWEKEITDIRSSSFNDARNFAMNHWKRV